MFLAAQEVNVTFTNDALVGCPTTQVARVEPEEGEWNLMKSKSFFSNGKIAAPKIAVAASETPSLKSRAQFSSKYYIYSAKVTVQRI
jgi:hypothetical protein